MWEEERYQYNLVIIIYACSVRCNVFMAKQPGCFDLKRTTRPEFACLLSSLPYPSLVLVCCTTTCPQSWSESAAVVTSSVGVYW